MPSTKCVRSFNSARKLIDERPLAAQNKSMEQRSESPVRFSEPVMIAELQQNHAVCAWRLDLSSTATETSTEDRRSEPRIAARAKVVVTPLSAVTTRLHGSLVNVSTRGVRVHFDTKLDQPRAGEVYRVQSGDDLMLCEVRHCAVADASADLGLKIVLWSKAGELKRLVQGNQRSAA
jgi:hypothetical protein